MKLHRFIGTFDLTASHILIEDKSLLNQLKNVLRLRTGDQIILCNNKDQEILVTVDSVSGQSIEMHPSGQLRAVPVLAKPITLYCALLKRENFELVAQKATEIGIARIVPLITARTVKQNIKTERVRSIMKEAAEQSGRGHVPALSETVSFEAALSEIQPNTFSLFLHTTGALPQMRDITVGNAQAVHIFIGPEGGWDEHEIALAQEAQCIFASLGPFILRGETAAITASYLASVMVQSS